MNTTVPFINYQLKGAAHLRVDLPPLKLGVNKIQTPHIRWHSPAGGDSALSAEVFLNPDGTVSHWAELHGQWERFSIRVDHLNEFLQDPDSPYSLDYGNLNP